MTFRSRFLKTIAIQHGSFWLLCQRSEPGRDPGHQRQTLSRHRIPSIRRMCQQGNHDMPPKSVCFNSVLPGLSIEKDQRGWPRQRRTSEGRTTRKTLSTWNRSGDSTNSARRPTYLIENDSENCVDFAREDFQVHEADRLHAGDLMLDSPSVDN
jgi:hypothetical protein